MSYFAANILHYLKQIQSITDTIIQISPFLKNSFGSVNSVAFFHTKIWLACGKDTQPYHLQFCMQEWLNVLENVLMILTSFQKEKIPENDILSTLKDKLLQNNIDKSVVKCIGVSSSSSFLKHIFAKCSVIYDIVSILFDFNKNTKKYLYLLKQVNISISEEIEIEIENDTSEQKLFLNFSKCRELNEFIFYYWLENIEKEVAFAKFKFFTDNVHKRNKPSLLVTNEPFEFFRNILVSLLSLDSNDTEVVQFQRLCPMIENMKISLSISNPQPIPETERQEEEQDDIDINQRRDEELVIIRDKKKKTIKKKKNIKKKRRGRRRTR